MVTITIKNIPDDIYERLKRSARANRRSINSEIIEIISSAVQSKQISLDEFLAQTRQMREKTAHYVIRDDEFNQAKDVGRP